MDSPENKKQMHVQNPILKLTQKFHHSDKSSERFRVNSKIQYIAFQKLKTNCVIKPKTVALYKWTLRFLSVLLLLLPLPILYPNHLKNSLGL